MATTKKITMKEFNGTDYDILYPKTDVNQVENLTPAAIGAVSKTGDTMTGNLFINKSAPEIDFKNTALTDGRFGYIMMANDKTFNFGNYLNSSNFQCLYLQPETVALKSALKLSRRVNGVSNYYNVLHEGNLSDLKVASIATGNYVGTGTCGPDNPNSLNLPFSPKILMIARTEDGIRFHDTNTDSYFGESSIWFTGTKSTLLRSNYTSSYTIGECYFTVSGNKISWYSDETDYPDTQMNYAGTEYSYIAIG